MFHFPKKLIVRGQMKYMCVDMRYNNICLFVMIDVPPQDETWYFFLIIYFVTSFFNFGPVTLMQCDFLSLVALWALNVKGSAKIHVTIQQKRPSIFQQLNCLQLRGMRSVPGLDAPRQDCDRRSDC